MTIEEIQITIVHFTSYLIWIGIPLSIFIWPTKDSLKRYLVKRFILSIFLVWILLIFQRFLALPIIIDHAQRNGYYMYDGIAGNLAALIMGWLIGLISTVPVALLMFMLDRIKKLVSFRQARLFSENF